MSPSLVWLVPPAAGALIGYVTNMVAIKMLFRPLREVRVLGIRLPFTPGILPRQRHKLADNIGAMVERELLTPEILKARLGREEVQRGIRDFVSRHTERILAAPLKQFFPASGEGGDEGREARFSRLIRFLFKGFFRSPVLGSAVREIGGALAEQAGNHSLRDILGAEAVDFLLKRLEAFAGAEIRRSRDRISAVLVPALKTAFPGTAASLIRFLEKEDIHRLLETHCRVFLNNAILRLNVFQRFVVSAGQYDKTLYERMPEIVDDLIRQIETLLADEDVRRRIITLIDGRVRACLSEKDVSERIARFLTGLMADNLDRPLGDLCFCILEELSGRTPDKRMPEDRGPDGREPKDQGEAPMPEARKPEGFWPALERHIAEWAGREGKGPEEALLRGLERFLEKHGDVSLGSLLSISDEQKETLDAFLFDRFLFLVNGQIDTILETINIRTLVRERIDALDMIAVERIVLDVMAHQLQWINVFGAILGALIGVFQSVFSWFLR
jgi:uncharacterized membrane-anchored protein YjiN (DUF445 family)